MRELPLFLVSALAGCLVGCGGSRTDDEIDGAAPPTDAESATEAGDAKDAENRRDAADAGDGARCPMPVDCGAPDSTICDLPSPAPARCTPITEFHFWRECSNGYVIITTVIEGSGQVNYYRDGKLVAVVGGRATPLDCWAGPPDFVEPPCEVTRSYDLCAKPDAGNDSRD